MSDEPTPTPTPAPTPAPTDSLGAAVDAHLRKHRGAMVQGRIDPVLSDFVNVTNQRESNDGALDLIVALSGMLVAGKMISVAEHARLWAKEFDGSTYWEELAAESEANAKKHAEEKVHGEPVHFHLRNVRIMLNNGAPPFDANLFRGRLDRVDGWTFGTLETKTVRT